MLSRVGWWAKFLAAVCAAVVGLASALRIMGVNLDIETKTEARVQHEQIKADMRTETNDRAARIEAVVNHIDSRIDDILLKLK